MSMSQEYGYLYYLPENAEKNKFYIATKEDKITIIKRRGNY